MPVVAIELNGDGLAPMEDEDGSEWVSDDGVRSVRCSNRRRVLPKPWRLVDAAAVAKRLGIRRDCVMEHRHELGGVPMGTGPRPRWQFDLDVVDRWIEEQRTCSAGRQSQDAGNGAPKPKPRCRRAADLGMTVELLPIRGCRAA